jgi:glycosyltransferase involved in cell wall biosynthesis
MQSKNLKNIVFNPFINDSRVLKESSSLANAGFNVEVIAHGDKRLENYEIKENFTIKRFCYLDRKITKSKLKKLLIYFKWLKAVITYTKNSDILQCNDLNTLPIAFVVKGFYNKNIKIVYDAHEYETETNGLSGVSKSITKILEKFFMQYVDKTITVSDGIADEYVKLYNIEKPSLVLNTPLFKEVEKKDIFRETFGIKKNQTIFLYQGSLGRGRGIEVILDTFKELDTSKVIVFMGYGQLEELLIKESKKYKNIYFHKAVTPDILLDYTSSTDFGIATIEDTCLSYHYCLPNKMFEYIMAEIPVIVSNLPEMKKIVEEDNLGIVAENNTIQGLKEAMKATETLDMQIIKDNLKKAKKTYSWQEQEKVLIETYREIWNVNKI